MHFRAKSWSLGRCLLPLLLILLCCLTQPAPLQAGRYRLQYYGRPGRRALVEHPSWDPKSSKTIFVPHVDYWEKVPPSGDGNLSCRETQVYNIGVEWDRKHRSPIRPCRTRGDPTSYDSYWTIEFLPERKLVCGSIAKYARWNSDPDFDPIINPAT